MPTPGNPLRKKKRPNTDKSICRKCQIQYGSKMDNDYGSIWINFNAKNCYVWVHLDCKYEDAETCTKIVKFYCNKHNPQNSKISCNSVVK